MFGRKGICGPLECGTIRGIQRGKYHSAIFIYKTKTFLFTRKTRKLWKRKTIIRNNKIFDRNVSGFSLSDKMPEEPGTVDDLCAVVMMVNRNIIRLGRDL